MNNKLILKDKITNEKRYPIVLPDCVVDEYGKPVLDDYAS